MIAKDPVMDFLRWHPDWWNSHGEFAGLLECANIRVRIGSNAANLTVETAGREKFKISYRINNGWRGEITGYVFMDRELLGAAFGLIDDLGESAQYSQWMLDRFGGTVARQGIFIRWRDFLNIPGPGTGGDGDANISLMVGEEIKDAIKHFLNEA